MRRGTGLIAGSPTGTVRPALVTVPTPGPAWKRTPGEALSAIHQQPLGEWLLAIVAVGLVAYGAYEVVQARYRVIKPA